MRKLFHSLVWFLTLCCLAVPAARAEEKAGPSATLPLSEVLRLYRESETKKESKDPRTTPAASVGKLELSGRLLDGAIDVSAHVELSVLQADDWVRVPLFKKDGAMRISRLPTVEHGVFTVADGHLCFLTNKAGSYAFDLGFLTAATKTGARRRADIAYPAAALAVLKLRVDEHLFSLVSDRIEEGDGYTLYPQGNHFDLLWDRTVAAGPAKAAAARRPPIEPVIPTAHASVVSTLEGRRIARILYSLQVEGSRPIAFTIPPRQTVDKVFVNGASVPFRLDGDRLELTVSPARAGDESARVELVLSETQGGYALSGRLQYTFPTPSWNVNDLYVTLSLPQVFNYQWEGGSLAPVPVTENIADPEFTQRIPTPGKRIQLHQQLLSTAATARITYTVDLSDSYYRAGAPRAEAAVLSGERSDRRERSEANAMSSP